MTDHTLRRARRATIIALALCASTTALPVADATAATYRVDVCQRPDGQTAPRDGWAVGFRGHYVYGEDECAVGGGLKAWWDPDVPHADDDEARWSVTAPPGTALVRITGQRTAALGPEQAYGSPVTEIVTDKGVVENCTRPAGCSTRSGPIAYDLGGAAWIAALVRCAGARGCLAGAITQITLSRVQLTFEDTTNPVFAGAPSGTLLSESTTLRNRSLSFGATDTGSGVFRQRLLVDDREVIASVVDANGGACAADPLHGSFTVRVPCKTSATGTLQFDTTQVADGTHQVRLEVTDATGENKAVHGPWTIAVDNLPPTIGPVTISGTPRAGDVLSGSAAVDGQGATTSYQWLRAEADGSSPRPIDGATSPSYRLTDADAGHKVLLAITATDKGGAATRTSAATDPPLTGRVVGEFCEGRPTGAHDECGDLDGDGVRNRVDPDIDGDGVPNDRDIAPEDSALPGRPATAGTTTATTTPGPATAPTTGTGPASTGAADLPDTSALPVANPVRVPGVNGTPADPAALLSVVLGPGAGTGRLLAGFDERPLVRGRITTAQGLPIGGAHVHLLERDVAAAPGAWRLGAAAVSAADGGFAIRAAPRGRTREIRVVYFPRGGRDGNRASNPLTLVVRQDAALALSRRVLHNGQTLGFRGVVRGLVPGAGARVLVQVRLVSGWFTFRRATASGRNGGLFTASYRFRRTTRPTRYRFRVKVVPGGRSTYAPGVSRTVSALVRP